MKYIIEVNGARFESNSRNAKKHLRDNGGNQCLVFTKSGKLISGARYSDEAGYYNIVVCDDMAR